MSDTPTPPAPDAVPMQQWSRLTEFITAGEVLVVSGAGLSTDSGLPSYRDVEGNRLAQPMTVSELMSTPEARQRYWARSYVGWPRFAAAQPNDGHRAVRELEAAGVLSGIITQNVDGLHQGAGSRDVVELHGSLAKVVCMTCNSIHRRDHVDDLLEAANPHFDRQIGGVVRPDGDVALPESAVRNFVPASCPICGSQLLKPDVVMFGESVPKPVVEHCFALVEAARCLLVLGSSLAVMSGYRFVRRAARTGVPVVILNHGWTRGDGDTDLKVDAPLTSTLKALSDACGRTGKLSA